LTTLQYPTSSSRESPPPHAERAWLTTRHPTNSPWLVSKLRGWGISPPCHIPTRAPCPILPCRFPLTKSTRLKVASSERPHRGPTGAFFSPVIPAWRPLRHHGRLWRDHRIGRDSKQTNHCKNCQLRRSSQGGNVTILRTFHQNSGITCRKSGSRLAPCEKLTGETVSSLVPQPPKR
jgi:hypothetical protein